MTDNLMIQAGLDFHYMFVDIWKAFVVVEKLMKNEWCIKERQTIPKAYVAKIIGYSTIDFFQKITQV